MSPGEHLRGSDWSTQPITVLWLADQDLTLICIGSQYRQSVIRTDHHPSSATLGLNTNRAKTNYLCLILNCLLCVQSLCQSAIFALFLISLSEALSKISDVIFNCYWLGIIQNKPIQLMFVLGRTQIESSFGRSSRNVYQTLSTDNFYWDWRMREERSHSVLISHYILTEQLCSETLAVACKWGGEGKELAGVSWDVLIIIVNWQSVWELAHQGSTDLSPL